MSYLVRPLASTSLLLCLLLPAARGPARGDEIDLEALVESARAVLESDLAAWAEFGFHRRVLRERLDKQGDVVWRTEYLFEIHPVAGGFDERLLQIDGRQPTGREVEQHRRAGRFSKHYGEAAAAKLGNPFGEDLPLLPLLFDQEHRYVGHDESAGIPCFRVAFDARQEPRKASVAERLKHAAKGTLCLSVRGTHVVEAEVESVRPVGEGPLRLNHLSLRFESRPTEKAWPPRLFETRSDIKLGFNRLQKRNRYEYTDYEHP